MLSLYLKKEKVEEIENGGTVNNGGRRIEAHESPTGKAIEPGSVFAAPEDWYRTRRHWHFLQVIEKTAHETPLNDGAHKSAPFTAAQIAEAKAEPPIFTADERPDLEQLSYKELQAVAKDLGLSAGGSGVAITQRITEFWGAE